MLVVARDVLVVGLEVTSTVEWVEERDSWSSGQEEEEVKVGWREHRDACEEVCRCDNDNHVVNCSWYVKFSCFHTHVCLLVIKYPDWGVRASWIVKLHRAGLDTVPPDLSPSIRELKLEGNQIAFVGNMEMYSRWSSSWPPWVAIISWPAWVKIAHIFLCLLVRGLKKSLFRYIHIDKIFQF